MTGRGPLGQPAPGAFPVARADLHVHTTHSDGVCTPCEVVIAAARVRLGALAITDHDTVSAIPPALAESSHWGVELIPGVEWTACFEEREVHILGYFLRVDDPAVRDASATLREARAARIETFARRLAELGLSIDVEALRATFPRATIGRRHLADWLVKTGQAVSQREAFERWLGDDGPMQVPKPRLDWREAIDLTRCAGGVPALAHPPYQLRYESLRTLADAGLGGIEVDGPGINPRLGRRWADWAAELGLIPVGGSDFHAADRPGRWVGAVTAPAEVVERLRENAGGR